jgi:alpha-mannosidase
MNGSDHLEAQPHLPKVIAAYNAAHKGKILLGTLPQFVEQMRKRKNELKSYRGEFRRSKHQNLLSGVYSSRVYLKQANDRCQRLLERQVEPWNSAARVLGAKYPLEEITLAWKYLLKNHPHDDICGCSIDQVHEDMMQRFRWIKEIGEVVLDRALDTIASKCQTATTGLVVYNALPYTRSGVAVLEMPVSDFRYSRLAEVRLFNPSFKPENALDASKNELHISFVKNHGFDPTPVNTREIKTSTGTLMEFEYDFSGLLSFFPQVKDMLRHLSTAYKVRVNSKNEVVEVWARKSDAQDLMKGTLSVKDEHGKSVVVQEVGSQVRRDNKAQLLVDNENFVKLAVWAENMEGLGVRRYDLFASEKENPVKVAGAVRCTSNVIENDMIKVTVLKNGTMNLLDKRTGEEYRGLLEFEDSEDVGDEYDYCPAHTHHSIRSGDLECTIEPVASGPLVGSIRINGELEVPTSIAADRVQRSEETVSCDFTTEVTLYAGSPTVQVVTEFNNLAEDLRLRVLFPTDTGSRTCQADGSFDVIERPIRPKPSEGWVQPTAPTYPLRNFVTMSSEKRGVTVTTTGMMEFENLEERGGTIAITLLRCVGWLSTVGMSTRPEAAGPVLETPGGQCPGEDQFEYAITPHKGNWLVGGSHSESESFLMPLNTKFLPASEGKTGIYNQGFLTVQPNTIKLSAFKESQDGRFLVLRLWNISDKAERCRIRLGFPVKSAMAARADETPNRELKVSMVDPQTLEADIQPKRIATILLDCR